MIRKQVGSSLVQSAWKPFSEADLLECLSDSREPNQNENSYAQLVDRPCFRNHGVELRSFLDDLLGINGIECFESLGTNWRFFSGR